MRRGKSAGSLSRGYRVKREPLADGSWSTGEREIDPDEAAIVTRIFRDYASGKSTRTIAVELNREGIPAPQAENGRGTGEWSHSTISGNWRRGTGILNNEAYIGKLVWNRQRYVKDPTTGKRQARLNPEAEWIVEDVPDLRIIDDALWQAVKAQQGAIRETILDARRDDSAAPRSERGRRNRYLLSALLKCGCCGAGYSMIGASRYACSAARNKGTCSNHRTISRIVLEEQVLAGLHDRLMAPDLIGKFIAEFQREIARERSDALAARAGLEKRHAQVRRQIARIVTAVTDGMYHPSMKAEMDRLEAEREEIETRLAAVLAPEPVAIHPGLSDAYRRKVTALAAALGDAQTRGEAAELLRGLIERIVIRPGEDGHEIELFGELGAILQLCEERRAGGAPSRGRSGLRQSTLVAGARNQRWLRLVEQRVPTLAA